MNMVAGKRLGLAKTKRERPDDGNHCSVVKALLETPS
jgi:hypothetical protein